MINLKNIKSFFVQRFEREKMVLLDNLMEVSVMFREYMPRILSLAYMRGPARMQGKMRLAWKFLQYLRAMSKKHGSTYVVKYLKASQLAISRSVAGKPMTSLSEVEPEAIFPRLSANGLPKFIGSRDRRRIGGGHKETIRFWLTLFSVYRIFNIPGKLKIATITDPFNGNSEALGTAERWFRSNSGKIAKRFLGSKSLLQTVSWELIEKSSSTSLISWKGMIADVRYLIQDHEDLVSEMLAYARLTGLSKWYEFFTSLGGPILYGKWVREDLRTKAITSEGTHVSHRKGQNGEFTGSAGRLSKKKEAAGKIRVFAMVDWWTQMLLKPLHLFLFDLLRKLPNDGTFNQDKAFQRAVAKAAASKASYGFDLSAATDRLPLSIQKKLLASLLEQSGYASKEADRIAVHWGAVLVDRAYSLDLETEVATTIIDGQLDCQTITPDNPAKPGATVRTIKVPTEYRYAVGQPMGALSSWAMLAITHHMIVQFSAREVGHPVDEWYTNYEVLGDDIVIFDHNVAYKYLAVMKDLGVGVNVAKSVISPDGRTVEFAKRTSLNQVDISPLSWKMVFSQDHFSGRVAIALWYLKRHFEHPQRILCLATRRAADKVTALGTSALALLTAMSGKRGITLESLLMGLINEKGKLLPESKRIRPDAHGSILVPTAMFIRKIKEFFKHEKPLSLWFSEHWVREEAVESLEVEIKNNLNIELANLVIKLCDESYVRKNLVKICTALWPGNEGNTALFLAMQKFVEEVVWNDAKRVMSEYQNSINDLYKLKGMNGLFQPKYLKMMSLEKMLGHKQRIEGVVALLEIHSREPSQKVPIPNSLKIIKILLKALDGRKGLHKLIGNPLLYTKPTILDPDSDFDRWLLGPDQGLNKPKPSSSQ